MSWFSPEIERTGTVREKNFPGINPRDCYLLIDTDQGERIKAWLHRSKLDEITVGDRVRFLYPKNTKKVRTLKNIERL